MADNHIRKRIAGVALTSVCIFIASVTLRDVLGVDRTVASILSGLIGAGVGVALWMYILRRW